MAFSTGAWNLRAVGSGRPGSSRSRAAMRIMCVEAALAFAEGACAHQPLRKQLPSPCQTPTRRLAAVCQQRRKWRVPSGCDHDADGRRDCQCGVQTCEEFTRSCQCMVHSAVATPGTCSVSVTYVATLWYSNMREGSLRRGDSRCAEKQIPRSWMPTFARMIDCVNGISS